MRKTDDHAHMEGLAELSEYSPGDGRWLPAGYPNELVSYDLFHLRYAVVDDIADGTAIVISYMWPTVTSAGTLNFQRDERFEAMPSAVHLSDFPPNGVGFESPESFDWTDTGPGMPLLILDLMVEDPLERSFHLQPRMVAASLAGLADESREVSRPLRVGDTFAVVMLSADHEFIGNVTVQSDERPFESVSAADIKLFDISSQARKAARAAQLAALRPTTTSGELDDLQRYFEAQAERWERTEGKKIPVVEVVESEGDIDDPRDARPAI